MAVTASDMIPEITPWPASSTRSSTLQDCWLEPRPHLVHLLLQTGKHERLCAAAKLRPERRRSATPDYAGASMHSGARRVLLLDSLVCHRMVMAPVGHSSGKRRCAEELQSDETLEEEREHKQRLRCRQASRMHP
jgi:hypothetical protein